MSSSCQRTHGPSSSTEFVIPMPWGHVAGKTWGNETGIPVLVVHGLGDNAGTFDRLIPHLPISHYYVTIDLPSHGTSSYFPSHTFISGMDYLVAFKMIIKHLKLDKYVLMGHSYGAQLLTVFAQLYPENVIKLILLDSYYFFPHDTKTFGKVFQFCFKTLANVGARPNKEYDREEAVGKIVKARAFGTQIDETSARALAKRALSPTKNNKYSFSADPRLKIIVNPFFDYENMCEMLAVYPFSFPCLFLYTEETNAMYEKFKIAILKKLDDMPNCTVVKVSGSHDVHTMNPNVVAPIINKFLLKNNSKI